MKWVGRNPLFLNAQSDQGKRSDDLYYCSPELLESLARSKWGFFRKVRRDVKLLPSLEEWEKWKQQIERDSKVLKPPDGKPGDEGYVENCRKLGFSYEQVDAKMREVWSMVLERQKRREEKYRKDFLERGEDSEAVGVRKTENEERDAFIQKASTVFGFGRKDRGNS